MSFVTHDEGYVGMELVDGKATTRGAETRLVHIEREINDHGTMAVHVIETRELRTVVGCASPGLRERFASATTGSEFPL